MIITKLQGGLGNQLFQYAVGRHLAEIHQTVVKLDLSSFRTYTLHSYSLEPFNIQKNLATLDEVRNLTSRQQPFGIRLLRYLLTKLLNVPPRSLLPPNHVFEKQEFHFDPEILNVPDNSYLEGYWQNQNYFIGIENILRQEFTVKTPPTAKNLWLANQIASCDSISVHVRRADFVSDPETYRIHGTCSVNYYEQGFEYLSQYLQTPTVFIFSDEPAWCHEHLQFPCPIIFVDQNDADNDYEDLRLMSQCRHHIIANSTFSWWGAWLAPYPEKRVIAPKRWMKSGQFVTQDLFPDDWILL